MNLERANMAIRVVCRGSVCSILFLCLSAASPFAQDSRTVPVKSIGCFSNEPGDGGRTSGYSVRLWFEGDRIIGLIDWHRELAGNNPLGILTGVRYDAGTGKISFKAKLTSSLHRCRIHTNVPSQELLSFSGFLKPDGLVGNIRVEDRLDSPPRLEDTRSNFVMLRAPDCLVQDYPSYDAWWMDWKELIDVRGAKW